MLTRRTSLARQSFDLPCNALCLRSRVLPPKFYFTCHDTYSRNRHSTHSNSHTKQANSQTLTGRAFGHNASELDAGVNTDTWNGAW
jgi:hypothetical protein